MSTGKKDRDYLVFSGKRPQPKRKKKHSAVRKWLLRVVAIALSVVLWPFGMFVLWLKRTKMHVSTKVLLSMITLIACVLLYSFLLNHPFTSPSAQAVQEKANQFLDRTGETALRTIDSCVDAVSDAFDARRVLMQEGSVYLSRNIPAWLEKAADAGKNIPAWITSGWQYTKEFFVALWNGWFGDDSISAGATASPAPTALSSPGPSPTPVPTIFFIPST